MEESRHSVADSIDVDSMPVEDKYEGPRLEEGRVTLQFMKVGWRTVPGTEVGGGRGQPPVHEVRVEDSTRDRGWRRAGSPSIS